MTKGSTSTPETANANSLSYKDAGVDIEAGNALVEKIKHVTKKTQRPEVMSELGGFGALCELPKNYTDPVLVSATDGVGTKLKLAMEMGKHDTIGIDLVAMCVNDLIVCGGEPLLFLDYYATGGLNIETATQVVTGIGRGCELAGCALIGGETAEMPGMYAGEDYDLAGFSVGVVEKNRIIKADSVKAGDVLIGLPSSGPHSNGYSLIRKILEVSASDLAQPFPHEDSTSTLGEALLEPTCIYVKQVLALHQRLDIHALAHITGGGFTENIPRVLPENTQAIIDPASWERPEIFNWLQQHGNVVEEEMLRTFNCGIGMIICVAAADCAVAIDILQQQPGQRAFQIGHIKDCAAQEPRVVMQAYS